MTTKAGSVPWREQKPGCRALAHSMQGEAEKGGNTAFVNCRRKQELKWNSSWLGVGGRSGPGASGQEPVCQ